MTSPRDPTASGPNPSGCERCGKVDCPTLAVRARWEAWRAKYGVDGAEPPFVEGSEATREEREISRMATEAETDCLRRGVVDWQSECARLTAQLAAATGAPLVDLISMAEGLRRQHTPRCQYYRRGDGCVESCGAAGHNARVDALKAALSAARLVTLPGWEEPMNIDHAIGVMEESANVRIESLRAEVAAATARAGEAVHVGPHHRHLLRIVTVDGEPCIEVSEPGKVGCDCTVRRPLSEVVHLMLNATDADWFPLSTRDRDAAGHEHAALRAGGGR